jgi:tRNA nucleotidyltransferase (CCA-adding enzyme)
MTGKGQGPEEIAARTSVEKMRELVDQSRRNQEPTAISNLAVNGNDLMGIGFTPGPVIGNTLRALVDHVIEVPMDNNRDRLLQLAQAYLQSQPS